MPNESNVTISRSYVDNYAVKEFTKNTLIPKYYPNTDVSTRSVGMLSFVTEQIATTTEDAFNTASVLFRETFPNRAELSESIYSHAAIFQLTNIFSSAAGCNFAIILDQEAIISNMSYDKNTGMSYFYIDKNLQIYVEDIPFVLDYDIMIRVISRNTESGKRYIFSASYIMDNENSISDITDPYIKTSVSGNQFLVMEVRAHQCLRSVTYEQIVTNSKINYPYIDINFDGKLAGFDVYYKTANESDYTTQMEKLLVYSQPLTKPFCYYQLVDEGTLRLSFAAKDTYFMPDFNSELKVILYLTEGTKGNFDIYSGGNVTVSLDKDRYDYNTSFITIARPSSSSIGGVDQLTLDELQSKAIMGYRTANALTTEADLNEYFKNLAYDFNGVTMRFYKRRNDPYERLYCCHTIISTDETIYKTNTLNLSLNLSDMNNSEKGVYLIEPGTVFTSPEVGEAQFYRKEENEKRWYQEYIKDVEDGNAQYINYTISENSIPSYFDRPCSFSEWKSRKGYKSSINVSELTEEEISVLDKPLSGKFLFVNPFLIRFTKSPSVMTTYLTHISQKSTVDFTNTNNESFVQFIMYQCQLQRIFGKEKKYTITVRLMPSITLNEEDENGNTYTPIATDSNGKIIVNNPFEVYKNDLRVIFVLYCNDRAVGYTELYPTDFDGVSTFTFQGNIHTDDRITSDNKLRILPNIKYIDKTDDSYYVQNTDDYTLCTKYDAQSNVIETDVLWDDVHDMVINGYLTQWTETVNMSGADDIMIPLSDVVCKVYTLYNKVYDQSSEGLTDSLEGDNIFTSYDKSLSYHIWTNEYSTVSEPLTFIKPLDNVRSLMEFKDFTLYDEINKSYLYDIMDAYIIGIPMVRYDIATNITKLSYFMETFLSMYEKVTSICNTRLRNLTNIDIKLYNTYGLSKNYTIGENNEQLNTVNISIEFDVWFIDGIDIFNAVASVKSFIREQIHTINDDGINNLYISNLMRKIEHSFEYVDHIRFVRINNYDSKYQTVKSNIALLNDNNSLLSKEDRRHYVPEMMSIDLDDIIINDYIVS